MSQKLILPINHTRLTASWKTESYRKRFGFSHYGIDMTSSKGEQLVYASGTGTVLRAGWDSVLGNCLVLQYDEAENEAGQTAPLICRMFHMASLLAAKGQRINKDTRLGYYGNTGIYSAGAHLHLELDKDIRYPFYTPTISGRSTLFRGSRYGASDVTMVNPVSWLYCKSSAPDYQTYSTAGDGYIRSEDRSIVKLT